MQKYNPPEGYLFDAKTGLYFKESIVTANDGKQYFHVYYFNVETGEYTQSSKEIGQGKGEAAAGVGAAMNMAQKPERIDEDAYNRPQRIDEDAYNRPQRIDEGAYNRPQRIDEDAYNRPQRIDEGAYNRPQRIDESANNTSFETVGEATEKIATPNNYQPPVPPSASGAVGSVASQVPKNETHFPSIDDEIPPPPPMEDYVPPVKGEAVPLPEKDGCFPPVGEQIPPPPPLPIPPPPPLPPMEECVAPQKEVVYVPRRGRGYRKDDGEIVFPKEDDTVQREVQAPPVTAPPTMPTIPPPPPMRAVYPPPPTRIPPPPIAPAPQTNVTYTKSFDNTTICKTPIFKKPIFFISIAITIIIITILIIFVIIPTFGGGSGKFKGETVIENGGEFIGVSSDGKILATAKGSVSIEYLESKISTWTNIERITMGSSASLFGLKSDGTVVSAINDYGGVSEWTDIVQIAAYDMYIWGLKSDGTIKVGMHSSYSIEEHHEKALAWTDIVEITVGDEFIVGLKSDGTVVAADYYESATVGVETWTDIVSISSSAYYVMGVKSDGTVVSSDPDFDASSFTEVKESQVALYSSYVLKDDGTVIFSSDRGESTILAQESDIVSISGSDDVYIGIRSDGTVSYETHYYNEQDYYIETEEWVLKIP